MNIQTLYFLCITNIDFYNNGIFFLGTASSLFPYLFLLYYVSMYSDLCVNVSMCTLNISFSILILLCRYVFWSVYKCNCVCTLNITSCFCMSLLTFLGGYLKVLLGEKTALIFLYFIDFICTVCSISLYSYVHIDFEVSCHGSNLWSKLCRPQHDPLWDHI